MERLAQGKFLVDPKHVYVAEPLASGGSDLFHHIEDLAKTPDQDGAVYASTWSATKLKHARLTKRLGLKGARRLLPGVRKRI